MHRASRSDRDVRLAHLENIPENAHSLIHPHDLRDSQESPRGFQNPHVHFISKIFLLSSWIKVFFLNYYSPFRKLWC
jgi:protein tyrosine/serine phosphatase